MLAEGARALDPPASPAQIDVWYRLSILDSTTIESNPRALRDTFESLRGIVADDGPFPVRYDALLAEEIARRRSGDPGPYVAAAERACASELDDSDRLCLIYRVEAGERGHAPSRRSVAADILDAGALLRRPAYDARLAAQSLCRNAIEGDVEALERVARLIVETEEKLNLPLFVIARLLDLAERLPDDVRGDFRAAVTGEFGPRDARAYDLHLNDDIFYFRSSGYCS